MEREDTDAEKTLNFRYRKKGVNTKPSISPSHQRKRKKKEGGDHFKSLPSTDTSKKGSDRST